MTKIMPLLILCIALVLLNFAPGYAQESYRGEVTAIYFAFEDDSNIEEKIYALGAEVYFAPVNTAGHPLAEAAFLERIGSVEVIIGDRKFETASTEGDGPLYGVGVTLMDPDEPIASRFSLTRTELKFPDLGTELEITSGSAGLGLFLAKSLFVGLEYTRTTSTAKFPWPFVDETIYYDAYSLAAKYVQELSGEAAFNIECEAEIEKFDSDTSDGSNTIIEISGDYYVNRRISLGAGVEINTGDDKDDVGTTVEINIEVFVSPTVSIYLAREKFNADDSTGEDEESIDCVFMARF